jgi:hypothetical protein
MEEEEEFFKNFLRQFRRTYSWFLKDNQIGSWLGRKLMVFALRKQILKLSKVWF